MSGGEERAADRCPGAAKGLKLLFWAQLLNAVGMGLTVLRMTDLPNALAGDGDSLGTLLELWDRIKPFLFLAALAVGLVALGRAVMDRQEFRAALIFTAVRLAVNVWKDFLPRSGSVANVLDVVSAILGLVVMCLVIGSTSKLARNLGVGDLSRKGRPVWVVYLIGVILMVVVYAVPLISRMVIMVTLFMGLAGLVGVALGIAMVVLFTVSEALCFISVLLYMRFLRRAAKALA